MERFGYNGGCDVSECPRIEAFKRTAGLGNR